MVAKILIHLLAQVAVQKKKKLKKMQKKMAEANLPRPVLPLARSSSEDKEEKARAQKTAAKEASSCYKEKER